MFINIAVKIRNIAMFYETIRESELYYNEADCLCPPHFHKAVEFLYVLSGDKPVSVNDTAFTLHTGELLVCMPYDVHSYAPSSGIQRCAVFPVELCSGFFTAVHGKTLLSNVFMNENFTADVAEHLKRFSQTCNPVLMRGVISYVLGRLLEEGAFVPANETGTDILREILAYIDEHYAEQITLSAAAKQFGYSKCHFSRLFHARFTANFTDYLNRVRVFKSLPLLKSHKISSVYDLCGFNSPQQYFLNFKKVMGKSPRAYLAETE